MKSESYARLVRSGLNGVVCFQETYNAANYKKYHPKGMKSIFDWRVNGFDRMGQAGVHKMGVGVLIGLRRTGARISPCSPDTCSISAKTTGAHATASTFPACVRPREATSPK